MSDKTCGTCAIGDDSTVWCSERGRRMLACQEACDEYAARAGNVERIRAARIEEIARRAVWILAHHPDSSHVFKGLNMEAELSALGVEV